jgi:hypothetical protein
MLNNYYTSGGKYIEYMTASDICNSTNVKVLNFVFPNTRDNFPTILNGGNGSLEAPPLIYIMDTLPKNAAITSIKFDIRSTDQRVGNNDGTQYELVLRYGNIDHPLTNKIWCVDFKTPNSQNYKERINIVSDIYEFKPFIKTENTDVKLLLKLYNRAPGHKAIITNFNIFVNYLN